MPFDEGVTYHARAAHAEGMPDGDGTAVDVEQLVGDAELVATIQDLDSEGLVELPQVHVVHTDPSAFQQPRYGKDRSDAHLIGLTACYREAATTAEGCYTTLFRQFFIHEHARGRAVG